LRFPKDGYEMTRLDGEDGMSRIIACLAASAATLVVSGPAGAESWSRFSASDRTVYLIDLDTLTPVEGVTTARMARTPAQGQPTDLSHETEEVLVRCADSQSRSGATVVYGPDGSETDRYAEETPWEPSPSGGVYGGIAELACGEMRPAGAA
jgi:hypothetical protein